MSEWVPKDQPRPIRILALHGYPNQSAASYRALLSPLIKALPQWYEFHFLEADFPCVSANDDEQEGQSAADPTSSLSQTVQALVQCSRLLALSGEKQALRVRAEMHGKKKQGDANASEEEQEVQRKITDLQETLQKSTDEGARQVYKEFTSHGGPTGEGSSNGLDSAESVLAQSSDLPPDRNWYLPSQSHSQAQARALGIQTSLSKIGTYIREHGPFHGGIGSGSGYQMLQLVSYLFQPTSHPHCAFQYPLLFPLLPIDSPAPRMGGWEVLPSVGLPSGRRHAVSQAPLLFVVRTGKQNAASGTVEQEVQRWSRQSSVNSEGEQATQEYEVVPDNTSSQLLFNPTTTQNVAKYIRDVCRSAESVPGLNPYEKRRSHL